MDIFHLNERVYKNIEDFLEGQNVEKNVSEETYYKSLYSPATLINDWYEKRAVKQVQDTTEGPTLSEHMDKFRKPCSTAVPDRKEIFNKVIESYGYGQELLLDHLGLSYYGNYVSSYDLCYNHLVKGICGPFPRRYYKGKYKPTNDLSLIYGNLTQWGLKEMVYAKIKEEKCREMPPQSESTSEFVRYDSSVVKKLNDFPKFKRVNATTYM